MKCPPLSLVRRWMLCGMFVLCLAAPVAAQGTPAGAEALKPYITNMEQKQEGMTLWQMMQSGGVVMLVLFLISIGSGVLVAHNFLRLKEELLIPKAFTSHVMEDLGRKDLQAARRKCASGDNVVARIVIAGLDRKSRGNMIAREAMESAARKDVAALWQNISYLSDVAAVAPLVGLLGTVIGMIQAFNVIAFQSGVVKPILLAGGVSKAMVTTAGGLVVAIPIMLFYAYFRGRVQTICDQIEILSADLIKMVEDV